MSTALDQDALRALLESDDPEVAEAYALPIMDLLEATASGNESRKSDALARLGDVMRNTMALAEVFGARVMLRQAAMAYGLGSTGGERVEMARFAASNPGDRVVPKISMDEAIHDLVARTPKTLRSAAKRTAHEIGRIYSQENAIAFARAADDAVTKEVQRIIAQGLKQGLSEAEAGKKIAQAANELRKRGVQWSRAYARMVYRTNVSTSVTNGRFRQAQDPDVKAVVPAFRFDSVGDSDTRDNHQAGDGAILSVDNPAWAKLAPPLGYNCRCHIVHVSVAELKAMGRLSKDGTVKESAIPAAWRADAGFVKAGSPKKKRRA